MRIKRLLAVAATLATGVMFGGAAPALASSGPTSTAVSAAVCGYSDTLYVNSTKDTAAYTCRWRSGMGTLGNYASTEDVARGDLYHHVRFENFSGRDIHLSFYRQGIRDGSRVTTTLAYNALVPRGDDRLFAREYSAYHYSNIRGVVKHHATDRYIYTPWINLEQCTGPGGDC